ncbi:FAD-dependent oxidoreductase [Streptantibioticus silvisoli]|uniref:NAD(P)/FAD-dependent oxidoreductase n=1 Tax=Streptantibioticus silvisoli TaxID=2705255 RepID=A0ABT6VT75_9ACTN|nr:NAD(P)/FAD-dependent oxidoreductase [Streptantibioticus silvisoli]MDI5961375.1 NAD(P)/FAD-dependent oxidoreductase [Streptantibioticus silvisoli]
MTEETLSREWETIVIGGGPSGLFAAHEIARAGRDVLLVEAGDGMFDSLCPRVKAVARGRQIREAEKFRLQCARCTCLTGIGGAAFHFDTNLGYIKGLTRSKVEKDENGALRKYSGLERALGSFERAEHGTRDVYDTFYRLGLSRVQEPHESAAEQRQADGFVLADTAPSQSITVDEALVVIGRMCDEITSNSGRILLRHRVTRVTRSGERFTVHTEGAQGGTHTARSVIVAVGKLGLGWVREVLAELHVEHESPRRVEVGVRLETAAPEAAPLTASCHNPKLSYFNAAGESVRTFCVCVGGRIMQYQFLDTVVLDGQHCLSAPTRRTNFGVVTTVNAPDGTGGTEYALDFARRVNKASGAGALVQSVAEFLGWSARPGRDIGSSLPGAVRGDLAAVLGPERVADVAGMVERLNDFSPGMIAGHAQVAAPVVERIYPSITLSDDLESSVPGLYFVGDSSSKIIGVTYGAVTGRVAARAALAR